VRRITPVILATLAGLGVLATFKTSPATVGKPLTFSRAAARTPASGAAPPRGVTAAPTTVAPAPTATPTTRSSSAAPTPTTAPAQRTFVGDDVPNQYGDVQVQITVRGNLLVDVGPLQMPSSHQRSQEISQQAAPLLRQEALQAQSAQIDLLSGATFTSESYAQSLQSALDRAGI
jgi:uncharacterized protein with FMN-binding domain